MTQTIVLGAGMVGTGTALALQAQGRDVLLLDRREPGRETSYGNAGIIQGEAVEPYALPRALPDLLAAALGKHNQVDWRLSEAPGWAGPLWSYWRQSEESRHARISRSYARLIRAALADHGALIAAAGADDLLRRDGFRQLFRSGAELAAALREAERLHAAYGVGFTAEDGAALARAEPGLRRALPGALLWHDSWSIADPGGLVSAYAALFAARGGRITTGDATSLRRDGAGWRVDTAEGPQGAEEVVVALGPWSPQMLAPLGLRIPMVWKRGYHLHFTGSGPRIPLIDAENSTVLSPMRAGLRVLTGAHITTPGTPPRQRQMTRATRAAGELFDIGQPIEPEPWSGNRPCLPRMLPIVGPAPGLPGLWLNFGHGHQGFTLGPTTGRLLADLMVGRPVETDLTNALAWPAR